jgi:hypothetical protein
MLKGKKSHASCFLSLRTCSSSGWIYLRQPLGQSSTFHRRCAPLAPLLRASLPLRVLVRVSSSRPCRGARSLSARSSLELCPCRVLFQLPHSHVFKLGVHLCCWPLLGFLSRAAKLVPTNKLCVGRAPSCRISSLPWSSRVCAQLAPLLGLRLPLLRVVELSAHA